jgi:copper(I)-binding protein
MKWFLVMVSALMLGAPAMACDGLEVSDAWVREAPPGADVMAAYARLTNRGAKAITLEGASGPDFDSVEMHRTTMDKGTMRMLAEKSLRLAPGASTTFEPGGLHLMLFEPRRALKAGDKTTLTLQCGKTPTKVEFSVRAEP